MPTEDQSQRAKFYSEEIGGRNERQRRAECKKRGEIYENGGKKYLIDRLQSEFGDISELRVVPLNVLKPIVNKKSVCYKDDPIRTSTEDRYKDFIDYYVDKLSFNTMMQKANRYYNIYSNTQTFIRPVLDGEKHKLEMKVLPPFLYSVNPRQDDRNEPYAVILSDYKDEANLTPEKVNKTNSVDQNKGFASGEDLIDSNEFPSGQDCMQIVWEPELHWTQSEKGAVKIDQEKDDGQFLNPIKRIPFTNIAKDRDNQFWAEQGEDTIENCQQIQMAMTDLFTIAKHQGFGIMAITSKKEPKQMEFGIRKAIWLEQKTDGTAASVEFLSANAPLSEYKEMILDLTALTVSSEGLSVNSVSARDGAKTVNSGIMAILEQSDNIQQVELDRNVFRKAEKDIWEVIRLWHNWLYDENMLNDEARALGVIADDFDLSVSFADIKPVTSEEERLGQAERRKNLGVITQKGVLRKLEPQMTDVEIEEVLKEVEEEKKKNIEAFNANLGQKKEDDSEEVKEEEESEEDSEDQDGEE